MVSYYWGASRDYIEPGAKGAAQGAAIIDGFTLFAGVLQSTYNPPTALTIRHSLQSLGQDIEGQDWWYDPVTTVETRRYQGGNVDLYLNGFPMVGATAVNLVVEARYGDPANPWDDSISARCSAFALVDLSANSPFSVRDAAKAFLADVGAYGIELEYGSYQPIGNGSFSGNGRDGGIFEVHGGVIRIGDAPLGDDCCTPDCTGRECGDDGCGGTCGDCDDGNVCTTDQCAAGQCTHQPVVCDDNDPCTTDSCNLQTGQCVFTPDPQCETRQVDLGPPYGAVSLTRLGPDSSCFRGTVPVSDPTPAFSSMTVTACYAAPVDPSSPLVSLSVTGMMDLGPWGVRQADGSWLGGLRCLQTEPFALSSPVAVTDAVAIACLDPGGQWSLGLEGLIRVEPDMVQRIFTGTLSGGGGGDPTLDVGGSLWLDTFELVDPQVRFDGAPGQVTATLEGLLSFGPPGAALTASVEGPYAATGAVALAVAAPEAEWSPVPGLQLDLVSGWLQRDWEGAWLLEITVGGVADAGPLGPIPLTATVDLTDPQEFFHCFVAEAPVTLIQNVLNGSFLADPLGTHPLVLCAGSGDQTFTVELGLSNWSPFSGAQINEVSLALERIADEWKAKLRVGFPDPVPIDLGPLGIGEVQGESEIVNGVPVECLLLSLAGGGVGMVLGGPFGGLAGSVLIGGICLAANQIQLDVPNWSPFEGVTIERIQIVLERIGNEWKAKLRVGFPEPVPIDLGPLGIGEVQGESEIVDGVPVECLLLSLAGGGIGMVMGGPFGGIAGMAVTGVICLATGQIILQIPRWATELGVAFDDFRVRFEGDAADWVPYVILGAPGEPLEISLGPLGIASLEGEFQSVKLPDGTFQMTGCVSGQLEAVEHGPLDDLPGEVSGIPLVELCLTGGIESWWLTLPEWHPLPFSPDYVLHNARGQIRRLPEDPASLGLDFHLDLPNLTQLCSEIPLSLPSLDAVHDPLSGWHVTFSGSVTVKVGDEEVEADFTKTITGEDVSLMEIACKAGETLRMPVRSAESQTGFPLPVLTIESPEFHLTCSTDPLYVDVALTGAASVTLGGKQVRGQLAGGGRFGVGFPFWAEAQVTLTNPSGQPVPLEIPGIGKATGQLCLGALTASMPGKYLCGHEASRGLAISAQFTLPPVINGQPEIATGRLYIDGSESFRLEVPLDTNWEAIRPADSFPSIRSLTFADLVVQWRGGWTSWESGIRGRVEFIPESEPGRIIPGKAKFTFDAITHVNDFSFQLDGRWLQPGGLPDAAVENPAFQGPLFFPPGIGDFALGTRGRWYLKTGGEWPPEPPPVLDGGEVCDDSMAVDEDGNGKANCGAQGVPGSSDPACVNHLACVARNEDSPIIVLGGAFYVDTRLKRTPWERVTVPAVMIHLDTSGLLVQIPTGELVKTLARLAENGWQRYLDVLTRARDAFRSHVGYFTHHLGSSPGPEWESLFGPGDITRLCDEAGVCSEGELELPEQLILNAVQVAISSHSLRLFDIDYAPGVRTAVTYKVSTDGEPAQMVGQLSTAGLLLEGFLPDLLKFKGDDLWPVTSAADPYRRVAVLNSQLSGAISVQSDPRLHLPVGTVEGWLQRSTWLGLTSPALLTSRTSGFTNAANGYSVAVGEPENGQGRVIVTFRNAGKTRVVKSLQGVVPPGTRTHVAVTWDQPDDWPRVRVRIFVNGLEVESGDGKALGNPDYTIGPGPSNGTLTVGLRLDLVDDVRLWQVALSPADLAAQLRFLPHGYWDDPRLVARYEFDFDLPPGESGPVTTVHNSRYHASAAKLHGTLSGGQLATDALGKPYARLFLPNLLAEAPPAAGLEVLGGLRFQLPLDLGDGWGQRFRLVLGGGKAEGHLLGPTSINLLRAPGLGRIQLTGKGPIAAADATFDDGLYGTVDLVAGTVSGSGNLQFIPETVSTPLDLGPAHFSLDCPDPQACQQAEKVLTTVLEPHFDIPLPTWPILKDARISGEEMRILNRAVGALAEAKAQFRGKLVTFGKELESDLFEWLPEKIAFVASASAPQSLPFHPVGYAASVSFTLLPSERTLCGEVLQWEINQISPLDGNCELSEICVRPGGELVGNLVCDSPTFCWTDADCNPPGQVEKMHCRDLMCESPIPAGYTCLGHPEWCESGYCAPILQPPVFDLCYDPGSVKARSSACIPTPSNLPSHCEAGHVCVGPPGLLAFCEPEIVWGGTGCLQDEQCPAGTVCRGIGRGASACLYPLLERKLGETCVAPTECASGVCLQGKCKCTAAYCASQPGSNYCADNGLCYPRLANGQDCCSPDQCLGGGCTKLVCTPPVYGKGGAPSGTSGKCFSPGSSGVGGSCALSPLQCSTALCVGGICRCTADSQCGSNRWCNLNPLLGQVGDCRNKIGNGQSCDPLMPWNCQSNRCGAYLSNLLHPVCYALDSKSYDQECIAWDQCVSRRCEPRQCSWSSNPDATCGAFWVAAKVAAGQWSQLAQCSCLTARCGCSSHGQCSSDRYCGSPEVFGIAIPAFRECRPDKGFGASCGAPEECQSGYCIQGTLTRNCGCSGNGNCVPPKRCVNGVCKL